MVEYHPIINAHKEISGQSETYKSQIRVEKLQHMLRTSTWRTFILTNQSFIMNKSYVTSSMWAWPWLMDQAWRHFTVEYFQFPPKTAHTDYTYNKKYQCTNTNLHHSQDSFGRNWSVCIQYTGFYGNHKVLSVKPKKKKKQGVKLDMVQRLLPEWSQRKSTGGGDNLLDFRLVTDTHTHTHWDTPQKPWMTAEVCSLLKTRDTACRSDDKATHNTAWANLSRAIREVKHNYSEKIHGRFLNTKDTSHVWPGIQAMNDCKAIATPDALNDFYAQNNMPAGKKNTLTLCLSVEDIRKTLRNRKLQILTT